MRDFSRLSTLRGGQRGGIPSENTNQNNTMFITAKRIPIHPAGVAGIQIGQSFEIDSGLGGSFTVRLESIADGNARFIITSSCPPPDGWRGQSRTYPLADLPQVLFGVAPENPFYDGGKAELAMLRQLGYPEDSPEIERMKRRFQTL